MDRRHGLTPDDIADALTCTQAREAVRCLLYAVAALDETGSRETFVALMAEAVAFAERLAGEVT